MLVLQWVLILTRTYYSVTHVLLCRTGISNHTVGLVHKNHMIRTCLMYHAACKVELSTIQTVMLTADVFQLFIKKKCDPPPPRGSSKPSPGGRAGTVPHPPLAEMDCGSPMTRRAAVWRGHAAVAPHRKVGWHSGEPVPPEA